MVRHFLSPSSIFVPIIREIRAIRVRKVPPWGKGKGTGYNPGLETGRYSRALGFETLSPAKSAAAQRKRMAALVGEVLDARNKEFWQNEWAELRRGWCLGGPGFRREMRKRATWLLEERKPGSLLDIARTEKEEESALKLLQKGLKAVGLTLEEVRGMKSSDPRKEVLTWLLKRRTPMRNTWIAERLKIGHSSRVCMIVRIVQAASEGPRAELKAVINSAFEC